MRSWKRRIRHALYYDLAQSESRDWSRPELLSILGVMEPGVTPDDTPELKVQSLMRAEFIA